MDTPQNQNWYLLKHEDASIFGPLNFEQVKQWAASAQIAPHDKLSTDQQTWMKAPMFPELGMDWLLEVTSDRYYGPTTLGAIAEFLQDEDLTPETYVINSCDGTRMQLKDLQPLLEAAAAEMKGPASAAAVSDTTGSVEFSSMELHERIRDLEQSLAEERAALQESERRYQELEKKFNAVFAGQPPQSVRS